MTSKETTSRSSLRRLRVLSFQAHERLDLKLDPGVTVIIGPTDSGKSSVVRALQWVSLNTGKPKQMLRTGDQRAKVVAWFGENKVVREYGGKVNRYKLDSQQFKAVGSKVPEPIVDVMRLGQVNFQLQYDAPFWFSATPGEVSRHLNKIVSLDLIDDMLSRVTSAARNAKHEVEFCRERFRDAKRQRKELDYVPKLSRALRSVEGVRDRAIELRTLAGKLGEIVEQAEQSKAAADRNRAEAEDAGDALRLAERKVGASRRRDELASLISRIESAQADVDVAIPKDELSGAEQANATLKSKAVARQRLEQLVRAAELAESNAAADRHEADRLEQQLHKRMRGRCPLCGSELRKS